MSNQKILRKLQYLRENLDNIKIRNSKFQNSKDPFDIETLKLAIAKLVEEMIETAIKVNNMLLEEKQKYAGTYVESFLRLGEFYDIDEKFLKKISYTATIRNRVVHEYESIDKKNILMNDLDNIIKLYEKYIKTIKNIL